ncbi:MAG TPA: GSU2403 family nucleotidyltransferase fold protein, partial [Thermomicrobiales bacterium]|nr:GSU2403 family nucleotidyltransferase fold protein [Thermomicrobiales bacterium]
MRGDEALLRRALAALGPYRPELIVVGAWAHRFFERHPLAQPLAHPTLMTEDADLASPAKLATIGDPIPKR